MAFAVTAYCNPKGSLEGDDDLGPAGRPRRKDLHFSCGDEPSASIEVLVVASS